MARSNKYSRARIRAKVRRPKRRGGGRWYYGVLGAVVVAGTVGIGLSAGGGADVHPTIFTGTSGDHWHAAFDVNVCGDWLNNPPEFTKRADNPNVYAGLHTHNDGFIHVEAAVSSEAGNNATLARFLEYGGWAWSRDSLSMWAGPATDPTQTDWSNGDECPAGSTLAGQTGVVRWSLNCKEKTGDANKYKIRDGDVVALAFLPKGEEIGVPPNATALPVGEDGNPLDTFGENKACSTAGPGGEDTTTTSAGAVTTTTAGSSTTTSTP
jgi:hypothetical protein